MKGWLKTSLIDYCDKISSVFFYGGCNFRCAFCQNVDLVLTDNSLPEIDETKAIDYLEKKKDLYEGVCITGGEPTLQKNLPEIISAIKATGLLVKLDTNGSNFEMLRHLIENKLVDYVAMDIKSSIDNYKQVIPEKYQVTLLENVAKSIHLLRDEAHVDYEFRSTLYPPFFVEKDLPKIAQLVNGAGKYYLQQYNSRVTLNGSKDVRPFKTSEIEEIRDYFKNYVEVCEIR